MLWFLLFILPFVSVLSLLVTCFLHETSLAYVTSSFTCRCPTVPQHVRCYNQLGICHCLLFFLLSHLCSCTCLTLLHLWSSSSHLHRYHWAITLLPYFTGLLAYLIILLQHGFISRLFDLVPLTLTTCICNAPTSMAFLSINACLSNLLLQCWCDCSNLTAQR